MNIISFFHMLSLPKPEYEAYCREMRLKRYQKYGATVRWLRLHSFAHLLLIPLMKLYLFLSGKRYKVLFDNRQKTRCPIIYCPTHIGGTDIEMSFCAIKDPCWILMGDPRELYKSVDGMLLQINGWIPMDGSVKEDRTVAKAQMIELLNNGGNLLLFPEGVQNISSNLLLNHLYTGAVELAIACNAEIIPIGIVNRNGTYYFAIGENIVYEGRTLEERYILSTELRDRMATLVWNIIESFPVMERKKYMAPDYEQYINEILDVGSGYTWTLQDVQNGMFKPKEQEDEEDVFTFFSTMEPRYANAFLYRGNERFWMK